MDGNMCLLNPIGTVFKYYENTRIGDEFEVTLPYIACNHSSFSEMLVRENCDTNFDDFLF